MRSDQKREVEKFEFKCYYSGAWSMENGAKMVEITVSVALLQICISFNHRAANKRWLVPDE
jgi:hypothetical protein